jgi:hypothetical protein
LQTMGPLDYYLAQAMVRNGLVRTTVMDQIP